MISARTTLLWGLRPPQRRPRLVARDAARGSMVCAASLSQAEAHLSAGKKKQTATFNLSRTTVQKPSRRREARAYPVGHSLGHVVVPFRAYTAPSLTVPSDGPVSWAVVLWGGGGSVREKERKLIKDLQRQGVVHNRHNRSVLKRTPSWLACFHIAH